MPPLVPLAVGGLLALLALAVLFRRWLRRNARQTVLRFRARLDRYKLEDRRVVRTSLLDDPLVLEATRRHVETERVAPDQARRKVERYVDEIVPFFKVLSYYKLAYGVSRFLSRLFYRVSVDYEDEERIRTLPRRDVVVYLVNHRSNMDYVVLVYVLAGLVSISWAVGEWARTWPLEYLFKTCGGYFVRRRFREPLYHVVLERYVQLITRNRVTQGIFPEGGLTRDGTLRPPKVGLLDAVVRTIRDPAFEGDVWLVPIGLNYDRVLEDRSLTRELVVGDRPPSRGAQLFGVLGFVGGNLVRLLVGQRRRYGRVAVNVGVPVSVRAWFGSGRAGVLDQAWEARRPAVRALADELMARIGAILPVTPVPLVAAALLSFQASVVPVAALGPRIDQLRQWLSAFNSRLVGAERTSADLWDRAWRTLHRRRWVMREGESLVIQPGARPLLEYYANSIRHLVPEERRWERSPTAGDDPSLPRLARA